MKITPLLILIFIASAFKSYSQNAFPKWDAQALVVPGFELAAINKPYTLVIYGGVGCGYSQYLIQHLDVLEECRNQCDIVLIMDQPKDSIATHLPTIAAQYPTFTNTLLQYKLRKKNDVFPQVLLFQHQTQVEHIVGIKEGMLTKLKERIRLGE